MFVVLLQVAALNAPGPEDKGLQSITDKDARVHLTWLADDAREGREAGSRGGHAAALYIADHYRRCGLQPGGQDGSYFLGFGDAGAKGEISRGDVKDANRIDVTLNAAGTQVLTLKMGEDFWPLAGSPDQVAGGDIVFAGYGIIASEHSWDDYKGVKVEDAVLLILDEEPRADQDGDVFEGKTATKYSDWTAKINTAQAKKARAVLIAGRGDFPESLPKEWPPKADPSLKLPTVFLSRAAADKLAKLAGKDLTKVQAEMDEKLKPESFTIKGKPARVSVARKGDVQPGMKDVVAIWPGTDAKLKDEYIVVGAHYDHVGMGNFGSKGKVGALHNGSDDNGSGTTALLELAEALPLAKFKRTVMIVSFDGEEKGLWGSKAYVDNPTIPMDKCRWMINMDMVSRNGLTEIAVGMTDATDQPLLRGIDLAERKYKFKFDRRGADAYVKRSDQWNFAEKGVPAIFMFGGMHADYHTENDDVEKANFEKVALISRISFLILHHLANKEK
jgi:hypothetical protein